MATRDMKTLKILSKIEINNIIIITIIVNYDIIVY